MQWTFHGASYTSLLQCQAMALHFSLRRCISPRRRFWTFFLKGQSTPKRALEIMAKNKYCFSQGDILTLCTGGRARTTRVPGTMRSFCWKVEWPRHTALCPLWCLTRTSLPFPAHLRSRELLPWSSVIDSQNCLGGATDSLRMTNLPAYVHAIPWADVYGNIS